MLKSVEKEGGAFILEPLMMQALLVLCSARC